METYPDFGYGQRPDGTNKGPGFAAQILPDGFCYDRVFPGPGRGALPCCVSGHHPLGYADALERVPVRLRPAAVGGLRPCVPIVPPAGDAGSAGFLDASGRDAGHGPDRCGIYATPTPT